MKEIPITLDMVIACIDKIKKDEMMSINNKSSFFNDLQRECTLEIITNPIMYHKERPDPIRLIDPDDVFIILSLL